MWTQICLHVIGMEGDVQFMANIFDPLQNFYIQNILLEVLIRKIEKTHL